MADKHASRPSTLHGILVELGIEPPEPIEAQDTRPERSWNVDEVFIPVPERRYELVLGPLAAQAGEPPTRIQIRANGVQPVDWVDLETGEPLKAAQQARPVRAFRLLD